LILRELAQCPPDEVDAFQQIDRYRYFNTNNLWIHLPALKQALAEHSGLLPLPLIRNEKPIDPTQPDSPRVYQLESAMGSAIGVFHGAQALRVPRTRFAPVKKNSDLLALWSDAYLLTEDWRIVLDPIRADLPPAVTLDDRYYAMIDEMTARFPAGAPSLIACNSLQVQGDCYFGSGVIVRGDVSVTVPEGDVLWIEDGTLLEAT
jgi:UTP--glucose-1-phosphate uridylyltransferase